VAELPDALARGCMYP